ncbi:MAG: hypothetical protein ACLQVI_31630 [Polyangiaceae bacterium]
MKRQLRLLAAMALLAACRPESHVEVHPRVEPPVDSPNAIPDAPVSGTVRGAPFAVRDARYVVDRRVGYAHTDLLLSAGRAESPCGPISPARATSVWLRLDGDDKIEPKDVRIGATGEGPWSVHYQVFDGETWTGTGEGGAILSIRDATADGRLSGGLAACFSDDKKSCVSGSFDAVSCPMTIDQPVRGTVAPEEVPTKYLQAVRGAADGGEGGGRR